MKKIISVLVIVAVLSAMFILPAYAADPVWSWDFGTAEGKDSGEGKNIVAAEDWVTVNDEDGDGWIYPKGGATAHGSFAAADAKYMAIKLRVTTGYEGEHDFEFVSHNGAAHGFVRGDVAATEGWQYIIVSTEGVGGWEGTINWVRIDPVNCKDCVADVDWLAFFADEASAQAYVDADKAADAPAGGDQDGGSEEDPETGDFGLIALAFAAISSVVIKKRKEN